MGARLRSIMMVTAAIVAAGRAAIGAGPAGRRRLRTGRRARAKPAAAQPGAPVPGNPAPLPQTAPPVAAPTPPPLPPAIWDALNAQDLLYYIQQIGREGLNPADYDPAGLIAAMRQPRSAARCRRKRPTASTSSPPISRSAT